MEQEGEYGGFWIRLLALAADIAILFVASFVILIAAAFLGKAGAKTGSVVLLVLPLLYWVVMQASGRQATFGKAMLGLKVVGSDGGRISWLRSFGRELAKIVSMIPLLLGFLIAAFTERKQALHDFLASTRVVREGPAHIAGAITVTVLGIVGPIIAIPLIGIAVFMAMIAAMFGDLLDQMRKFAPQIQVVVPAPTPAQPPKAPVATPTVQAPAAPPAPAAPSPTLTGNPEQDFDRLVGAPLTGFDRPGTTRAGPAILELSTFFTDTVWVKIYLPMPAVPDAQSSRGPTITVNRALDQAGNNWHDQGNTFEMDDFFRRPMLTRRQSPVPHLEGTRSVHLRRGLSEQALQKVEGQIDFVLPVDPKAIAFEAAETGKEKTMHDSAVTLVAISGGAVRLRFRGATEHLLVVRGFGADGLPVAVESRQVLPQNQDVDQEFMINFKTGLARVEAVVAARIIERFYPFSLVRGATAGPPASAGAGHTVQPRARTAPVAR